MRVLRSLPGLGFALAAALALTGCGGVAQDATAKELSALTAEISKLRAQQAAHDERLAALERGKRPAGPADAAAAAPVRPQDAALVPPPPVPTGSDRPALDVVRLGPSIDDAIAEEGDGDIDADGPRTVLRSSANGSIVSELAGPGGAARATTDSGSKKPAPAKKKSDNRPKTASLPTP